MSSRDRLQLIDDLKLGVDFHLDRVRELAPLAHRFIFGADATAKLARITQETEKLIIDNRASLIPPYPVTYIEFVYSVFLEKLGRTLLGEPAAIGKIGYLKQGTPQGAEGDQGSAGDGTRTGRWDARAPTKCDR